MMKKTTKGSEFAVVHVDELKEFLYDIQKRCDVLQICSATDEMLVVELELKKHVETTLAQMTPYETRSPY